MAKDTFIADGVVNVNVNGSRLVIRDGFPCGARETVFSRVERDTTRLIICGRMGNVTLEAMRWMQEVGMTWSVISDGNAVGHGQLRGADSLLIRAQALLPETETGAAITRFLLDRKIEQQAANLHAMGSDQAGELESCREEMPCIKALDKLRNVEARAAKAYWSAWSKVTIQFQRGEKVLDHWCTFDSRLSPISCSSPRNAGNPINAMLNYAYGVLENETKSAILTMGLDPVLGILHTDQRYRYSMAHDMMEPARPLVDWQIYQMLEQHSFTRRDFVEASNGRVSVAKNPADVKLRPRLNKVLAEMVRDDVIPQVHRDWERVLNMIVEDMSRGDKRERTPLTKHNMRKRFHRK